MKHFTTFATTLLLWLCAITAWADGVVVANTYTTAGDITEGYYLIKAHFKSANGWKDYYAYHMRAAMVVLLELKKKAVLTKRHLPATCNTFGTLPKMPMGSSCFKMPQLVAFFLQMVVEEETAHQAPTLAMRPFYNP